MSAPAPTELLAEDVRHLWESNRDLATEIKGVQNGLTAVQTELASVRTNLKWIRALGAFIAAVLIAAAGGAGTIIWKASTLTTVVEQQGNRLGGVDQRLDRVDQRLDRALGYRFGASRPSLGTKSIFQTQSPGCLKRSC